MSDDTERVLRQLHEAGDLPALASATLQRYGRELLGFLIATMGSEAAASEAFSATCEKMWRGLPAFEWRSSLRTWLYVIARNAAAEYHRSPHHRPGHHVPLSQVSEIVARIRTETAAHLKTENKDAVARLRRFARSRQPGTAHTPRRSPDGVERDRSDPRSSLG